MSIVDNLLVMVDNHDSSSKTGEAKLPEYLKKVPFLEFECIDRVSYQKIYKRAEF